MKDFLINMVIAILLLPIVLAVFGTPIYFSSKYTCLGKYESFTPAYSLISGCRVMHDGKIIPVENLRVLND